MLVELLSAAMLLAWFNPAAGGPVPRRPAVILAAAAAAAGENPLAREPLYADIVARATALRHEVEAYQASPAGPPASGVAQFRSDVAALAALDMKGHVDLAKRGTDGDLKCILKGISEDLPNKLQAMEQAATPAARQAALKDMFYLLRDNIEVITTPPTVTS